MSRARSWIASTVCVRDSPGAHRRAATEKDERLRKQIADVDARVDDLRRKIVATKEGGAVTGEERLREHTDQLYGALLSYEGRPGPYHLARIDALQRELNDITSQFTQLVQRDVSALNVALKGRRLQPLAIP